MVHLKKDKGDLAVYKAIADLGSKGYAIFLPLSEHLRFDLIAYKHNKMYRIQVKHSSDGRVKEKTSWTDKNGSHYKKYENDDFEYFAIYLPKKDVVVYPSISFKGKTIKTKIPRNACQFYWYEDFLDLTNQAMYKTYKDFGQTLKGVGTGKKILSNRKVERPSKEELEKLVWEIPSIQIARRFGVSDRMIGKWCQYYQIPKPSRGYWTIKKQ